ncbi:MAG: transposase, partial [Anaerolineae bacterium]
QLYRYCVEEKITFTRGRAGRKNDNAYVEQKNWSVVRRAVGYGRYDSPEQLDLLNTLYARLHLYVNFFLPVMKLEEKVRIGSRVKRIYDDPLTPYARLLANHHVSDENKAELREAYSYLDLIDLRQRIDELQRQLVHSLSPAQ